MNLYFEDETINYVIELHDRYIGATGIQCRLINNSWSYKRIKEELSLIDKTENFRSNNIACLTLAHKFWDEENHRHNIFLKDKNGKWRRIQDYVDKDLRFAHNIEKLYIAGEFGYCPADREVE